MKIFKIMINFTEISLLLLPIDIDFITNLYGILTDPRQKTLDMINTRHD